MAVHLPTLLQLGLASVQADFERQINRGNFGREVTYQADSRGLIMWSKVF